MREKNASAELTALIAALLTAQWLGSGGTGLIPAAGNAAYLSIVLAGAGLAMLCLALRYVLPQANLYDICRECRALRGFPLFAAALLTLLSATALRDALSMLRLTLLPKTPRWFALALLLPAVFYMSRCGATAVLRTVKLLAPVLAGVYALVLVLSGWGQYDVYGLFPLLGTGFSGIGKATGQALTAGVWLVLLLVTSSARESRSGVRGCLWAAGLSAAGYACCAMLQSGGSAEAAYPLHRVSLSGGLSFAFERMQAVFVFAWLPVQAAAVSIGLAHAARCTKCMLPERNGTVLLWIMAVLIAALAFPDPERTPAWLNTLLQSNTQCLLILPLLIPLGAGTLREIQHRREEKKHA